MKFEVVVPALLAAGASALPGKTRRAQCVATKDYTGWSNVKHAFILYDPHQFPAQLRSLTDLQWRQLHPNRLQYILRPAVAVKSPR
jgi:hypothetical protein